MLKKYSWNECEQLQHSVKNATYSPGHKLSAPSKQTVLREQMQESPQQGA